METYAIDGRVCVTSDYGKFKRLEGNRDVLDGRKNKIIKSIKSVGYIPSPIVVNDKMEIIDGAGRYEAAKQLELPIYYVVVPRLTLDHCIAMNVNSTNWSMRDFINSYAEQGNSNYIELDELIAKHPEMPLSVITASATTMVGGAPSNQIKIGEFTAEVSFKEADASLTWLESSFPDLHKYANGKNSILYCALLWAYRFSTADERRLVETVRAYKNDLPPATTIKYTLEQITKLYNKNLKRNHVYINIEYDAWLSKRIGSYKSRWGYK